MRKQAITGLLTGLLIINFGLNLVLAQETVQPPSPVRQESSEVKEAEVQWVWGEVSGVDMNARQISVKYLDYDTDTEKEIAITVDDKTTFENVKAIDEIKALDTVSIDYAVSPDGANIAKNISVEKIEIENPAPEAAEEAPKPAESQSQQPAEETPAEAQPQQQQIQQ